MNPIKEYYSKIENGSIIVSKKVERVYRKLVDDIDNDDSIYEYDDSKAHHAIDFVEKYCKHSKAEMGGQPFKLELWQKAMTSALFGFIHKIDGTRKYREFILIVARKNGKSAWSSAIALYLLMADGEPGPEIVSAATKKDQSKIIWLESKKMVNKSPSLKKRVRSLVSELLTDYNDGSYRPLSSDSNTLDGLNIHASFIDELHAIKNKNLYDVIVDGMSARRQPVSIITSTAGTIREGIFDIKYDEAERIINGYDDPNGYHDEQVLPIVYELDERDEWVDPKTWAKANPGLGTIKKFDELERKVNKAKANPLLVKNLLTKDFNIRESSDEAWLSFDDINNQESFDLEDIRDSYAVSGTDLSSTYDLTCATLLLKRPEDNKLYCVQQYFIPEDLIDKKVEEENIPYDKWEQMGWVTLTPGNRVDYSVVTDWYIKMVHDYDIRPLWNGYDSWNAVYWTKEMTERGFEMEEVRMGYKTLSQPMKELATELSSKNINYQNNPVLKWCLTNTSIKEDDNGNIRPVKGVSQKMRIDGMMSLLIAYVILQNHLADYDNII